MQQPGEAVSAIVGANSMSSLWARVLARSKGVAVPFTMGPPALADDYAGNQKIGIWNKAWFWWDSVTLLALVL
eukprot:CAMPEP_0171172672 /NCGR_PEP_ID=MMETSP0790-20130122/9836_1 /TAXON_ID=2925 /ORGANISM="Alexandrium catenella, Strain OF101" /LENGTH=72 /DNA_ID=CAMNT_0011637529 /DNA_START=61 /DNA_END=275 /DNA_ORIENTATION=+